MADEKKISGLTEASDASASDEFVMVNKAVTSGADASASGQTSKITLGNLRTALFGGSSGSTGNDIIFAENGGNVGIGTPSPSARLHVQGDSDVGMTNVQAGRKTPVYLISNEPCIGFNASYSLANGWQAGAGSDQDYSGIWGFSTNDGTLGWSVSTEAKDEDEAIDYHQPFIIKQNGNVGIGTADPDYLLDLHTTTNPATLGLKGYGAFVDGSIASQIGFLGKDSNDQNRDLAWIKVREHDHDLGSGSIEFETRISGNKATRMVIDHTGNVGIGTLANPPQTKLEIYGDRDAIIRLTNQRTNEGGDEFIGGLEFYSKDFEGGGSHPGAGVRSSITSKTGMPDGSGGDLTFSTASETDNNLPRMTIDKDGNVGIGTSDPKAKLHVKCGENQNFLFRSAGTVDNEHLVMQATDDDALSNVAMGFGKNGNTLFIHPGDFISEEAGTTNGRVGIGTSNPSHDLTIGDGNHNVWIKLHGSQGHFQLGSSSTGGTDTQKYFSIYDSEAEKHRLFITEAGHVMVGTTNSNLNVKLNVESGDQVFRGYRTTTTATHDLFTLNSNVGGSNTNVFKIEAGGRVLCQQQGIGTTTPHSELEVRDPTSHCIVDITSGSTSHYSQIAFCHDDGDSGAIKERASIQGQYANGGGGEMRFYTDTAQGTQTERMTIQNNGHVNIIGTLSSNSVHLTGFDADNLDNIRAFEASGLDNINNLVVSEFEKDGVTKTGIVAQDMQKVLPQSVSGGAEHEVVGADVDAPERQYVPLATSNDELVATLVKAVQELSAKNDELSAKVDELGK